MARVEWMKGAYSAAKVHFQLARDLDTLRFRADSNINDINRSVASTAGAELVDADAIFSDQTPNGVTGSQLVYEHVHMTPLGNYTLARAMFRQIASSLPFENGYQLQDAEIPSEAECERVLAFTNHDQTRIAAEMLQRLQRPPFTNQLNHSDQVLRLSIRAAIARRPDDRVLHYNYGLWPESRPFQGTDLSRAS